MTGVQTCALPICDVHDVHDDLHLLAEYDIIHFEEDGRAKKPYVPYDTVRIEVEFGLAPR